MLMYEQKIIGRKIRKYVFSKINATFTFMLFMWIS